MDSRIEKEKEWHNERFDSNIRDHLDKYYSINTKLVVFLRDKIFSDCSGQKILEYGCGLGSHAFELALSGAIVHGIDISDVAIQKAHEIAVSKGIASNVNFQVMNAEELSFDNNYFDKVCGSAILHHLDLNKAMPELARVLKKDGKAIFGEPLGHNPFINLYRKLTPRVRTEDEHPLLKDDLKLFSKYFKSVDIKILSFNKPCLNSI